MKFIKLIKSHYLDDDDELKRLLDVRCDYGDKLTYEDIDWIAETLGYEFEQVKNFAQEQGYIIGD